MTSDFNFGLLYESAGDVFHIMAPDCFSGIWLSLRKAVLSAIDLPNFSYNLYAQVSYLCSVFLSQSKLCHVSKQTSDD